MHNVVRILTVSGCLLAGFPCLLAGFPGPDPLSARQSGGWAFVNARVIPMRGGTPVLERQTVLVLNDTIAVVRSSDGFQVPPGVVTIDAAGRYLVPGLSDLHVHLRHESEFLSFARHGVTTVLQMNQDRRTLPNLADHRRRLRAGRSFGPTMYWTGPLFDTGRFTPQGRQEVTVETVPSILQAHRAAGYDFIKIHNMIPADVYTAIVAADVLPVIGHLPVLVGAEEALRSGQRMIAHAELFYYKYFFDTSCLSRASFWECVGSIEPDYELIPDITRAVLASGVTVTANLSVIVADLALTRNPDSVLRDPESAHLSQVARDAWQADLPAGRSFPEQRRRDLEVRLPFVRALVRAFSEAGVPLLAGTDTYLPGLYAGTSLHLELAELVGAGLTPREALRAATVNPGTFIRRSVPDAEVFGVIAPGARADLLLVDANPLDDIGHLRSLHGVMIRGNWKTVGTIDSLRAAASRDP